METYKQHLEMANERYRYAEKALWADNSHTAAHLFINASANYHNALCQKFLQKIPARKPHSDTAYFGELAKFLGRDAGKYQDSYRFLMAHKSEADYGIHVSPSIAKQIQRNARAIKEIAEALL